MKQNNHYATKILSNQDENVSSPTPDERCICCNTAVWKFMFSKPSQNGEIFQMWKCRNCGLEMVWPQPAPEQMNNLYEDNYFSKRTNRGYNNYFSDALRTEITRVLKMNLADIGFFEWEKTLPDEHFALDVGCAAGYSVDFLATRGWRSQGIDVSQFCVDYARNHRNLQVTCGNYLDHAYQPLDLITLWATIEHLAQPQRFLQKIATDLKPGGRLIVSTCRTGFLNFKTFHGSNWRYYNVPEHLFYFNLANLRTLLKHYGLTINASFCYGSGFGKSGTITRKSADWLARHAKLGDMLVFSAIKEQ